MPSRVKKRVQKCLSGYLFSAEFWILFNLPRRTGYFFVDFELIKCIIETMYILFIIFCYLKIKDFNDDFFFKNV